LFEIVTASAYIMLSLNKQRKVSLGNFLPQTVALFTDQMLKTYIPKVQIYILIFLLLFYLMWCINMHIC
jgi:uncharacterized membrane protein